MRRRQSTEDIERLAKVIQRECREVMSILDPPRANGAPPPPMPDPGCVENCGRRGQAKNDLDFWRRQRDKLMDRLADRMAEGTVTV